MVDGLLLPVAVGGHPALDFCNTRAGWESAAPKEYLRSWDHLVVWAREAGLLDAGSVTALRGDAQARPAVARRVLRAALEFREAAYPVLLGHGSAASFATVAARVHSARAATALRLMPAGSPGLAGWVLDPGNLDVPLLAVALRLGDLMCSPLSWVVAACPGRGCGWLFADPRGRRRWCDMAVCGNRAKSRRHAERISQAAQAATTALRSAR